MTCTFGEQGRINDIVIPQYFYKLACQYNNASDTILLKASNTKAETEQEKSDRDEEVFELRDARIALELMG